MVTSLKELFGDVDNLSYFVHPKYKEHFSFLSDKKIIILAQKISKKIINSPYEKIIVIESGASPFARLCEELIAKQKKVQWRYIKFPRESVKNIFPVFSFYLEEYEKKEILSNEIISEIKKLLGLKEVKSKTRDKVLKEICKKIPKRYLSPKKQNLKSILENINNINQNKYQKAISIIFQNTRISNFLKNPFLFFDEYIDSGVTLINYQHYLNFICKNSFKVISYQIMIKESEKYQSIYFTLYDLNTQLKCYKFGVYPFENRIDLIGYFYYLDNDEFKKVQLKERLEKNGENTADNFIIDLERWITHSHITDKIKNRFSIKQVGTYIDITHILRYCLFALEKENYSYGRESEFLWLAFDMYGPIWSPLPDNYHLEFMEIFEKEYNTLINLSGFEDFKKKYGMIRNVLLKEVSSIFIGRREKRLNSIKQYLKTK